MVEVGNVLKGLYMSIGRYDIIDQIGQGGMGRVLKAYDRLTGTEVALKQLLSIEMDNTQVAEALAREFRSLAALRHPNVIIVKDYGFDTENPFFTMELLDNTRDFLTVAKDLTREQQVRIVVQLLHALQYLHRRGILHRDLKPGNIHIDAKLHVKVLDFGLATAVDVLHRSTRDQGIAGTMAYMAPELFQNAAPSVASDLFAVGVIAYEMFTGQHPFMGSSSAAIMYNIVMNAPDLSPLADMQPAPQRPRTELPDTTTVVARPVQVPSTSPVQPPLSATDAPSLADILARLLHKDPAERYATADKVIQDLVVLFSLDDMRESDEIRESYLQTATFVGRTDELAQLQTALAAAKTGQGSAWLIGGESGIGKSRLIDELRIHALINGFNVYVGQATPAASTPFEIWRQPVRHLLLSVEVDDNTAGILVRVVPDTADLLMRPVVRVPSLPSAEEERQRTATTIVDLLHKNKAPTVLLLEDLQWARIQTLQQLVPHVDDVPLLVIGTFRNDERPELATDLAAMQQFTLSRLELDAVESLTSAVLATDAPPESLVKLVQRESEGNVFFLIEVLRALAEVSGSLDEILHTSLPERVLAGGVVRVLQQRIDRLPADGKPLLTLAAAWGRSIDPALLQHVYTTTQPEVPAVPLDAWLGRCHQLAILEPHEDAWRFAHDRLREHILESQEHVSHLYERAATLYASYHATNNTSADAGLLADLWQRADQPAHEYPYRLNAATAARESGMAVVAAAHLQRAIEIDDALQREVDADLLLLAANTSYSFFDLRNVRANAERLLNHDAVEPEIMVQAMALLAEVCMAQGDQTAAASYLAKAHAQHMDTHDDTTSLLLRERTGSIYHRQARFRESADQYEAALQMVNAINDPDTYHRLAGGLIKSLTFLGEIERAEKLTKASVAYYEQVGAPAALAHAYGALGIVNARQGKHEAARDCYLKAMDGFRKLGQENLLGNFHVNLGVALKNLGDIEGALTSYEAATTIFDRINMPFASAATLYNQAGILHMLERSQDALVAFFKVAQIGTTIGSATLVFNAANGVARINTDRERYDISARLAFGVLACNPEDVKVRASAEELMDIVRETLAPDVLNAIESKNTITDLIDLLPLIEAGVELE